MALLKTKNLFKQYNPKGKEDLTDWRRRFIEIADPTEYRGAIELLGSWNDWQTFKRNWPTFKNKILIDWLSEVEVRLRSKAIANICEQAMGEKGTTAAKWLAEGKYKSRKPGAPSKAEIERQTKIEARLDDDVQADIARVQEVVDLKIVSNG
jgi:hypothetical protein